MNKEQLERIHTGKGFIAALDQSGGSTPKALLQYGITEDRYSNDEEMFELVHEMRTRIITSSAFDSKYILGTSYSRIRWIGRSKVNLPQTTCGKRKASFLS